MYVTSSRRPLFSQEALDEGAAAGDELLTAAGHWTVAARALRYVWEQVLKRGHIGDIWSPSWETILPADLLQYLRTQKFQEARARQEGGTTARIRAKSHMGAVQNVAQI